MLAPFRLLFGLPILAALLLTSAPDAVAGERSLHLTTRYFDRWVGPPEFPWVARWGLQVTLDARGGKGVLELDPNVARYNRFGDLISSAGVTELASRKVKVTLRAEDIDQQGRRLYQIEGQGLGSRLALVLSPTGPHRLLLRDESGAVREVFPLK